MAGVEEWLPAAMQATSLGATGLCQAVSAKARLGDSVELLLASMLDGFQKDKLIMHYGAQLNEAIHFDRGAFSR